MATFRSTLIPFCVTVIMTALSFVEKSVTDRLSTGRNISEHLMFMSHGICVLVAPVVVSLAGGRLCR